MNNEEFKKSRILKINVITLSDRAYRGEYQDLSGPEIVDNINNYFNERGWNFQTDLKVIPDDAEQLETMLLLAKSNKIDIVISTGGTGIGPRDFTPEVAKKVIEKEIPGIMENIRLKFLFL